MHDAVHARWPNGPDAILDLVGGAALLDSLQLVARGGIVCSTGSLSATWTLTDFDPMAALPSGTKLTVFKSEVVNAEHSTATLQRIVDDVERGVYNANLDRLFPLEKIAEAHRYMESNAATGKVVGVT